MRYRLAVRRRSLHRPILSSWTIDPLNYSIDPLNCPVGPVLEFLQERMTAGVAATTLRVYVAAIAARRELDEIPLKLSLEGYPWRIFVLRQDGPLRTPFSSFTTLTLIWLQVLRSCLFEPTVCCWFIIGPDRQRFQLGVFGISFPMRLMQH